MVWIIRILYFVLFLLLLSVIRSVLSRVLNPSYKTDSRPRAGPQKARKTIAGQMIKDPQCGMYVATDLAITARVEGKTLHFCSQECRDHFVKEHKRSNRPNRQVV